MSPLEASGKPLFFGFLSSSASTRAPQPDAESTGVRVLARSLAGMQKEALVNVSGSPACWRLASDEGAYLNGDDVAPCPLSFLTVGMVCSFLDTIAALARRRESEISGLRLIQDNYYTMHGSALAGTMVGGALPVELTAEIGSLAAEQDLRKLVCDAVELSPIFGLLRETLPSLFTLSLNGREISSNASHRLARAALAFPADEFERAQPERSHANPLVMRDGGSPVMGGTPIAVGSSYAEHQDRKLHVRGICTLRPDGVKAIEQQLFSPRGSVFHFLSEEGPEARAPGALAYASAGIAFCFLTQLGRYAKITRNSLKTYSVVQDTLFEPCVENRPGKAWPVETHVHLESSEDEECARTSLHMAEQTCFLHALCRTPLNVNVHVNRLGS